MVREKVGMVTQAEKEEILKIYERKLALEELFTSLANPAFSEEQQNRLYEKIVLDLGKTKVQFDEWWAKMPDKYQWKGTNTGQWNIDFETNEIFLVDACEGECGCEHGS